MQLATVLTFRKPVQRNRFGKIPEGLPGSESVACNERIVRNLGTLSSPLASSNTAEVGRINQKSSVHLYAVYELHEPISCLQARCLVPPASFQRYALGNCQLGEFPVHEVLVTIGEPSEEIIRMAKKHNADLVVMGKSNHSLFGSNVMGSTARRVTRHCPIPVLIVPNG